MIDNITLEKLRHHLVHLWDEGGIWMLDGRITEKLLCGFCNHENILFIPVSFQTSGGSTFNPLISRIQQVIEHELITSGEKTLLNNYSDNKYIELPDDVALLHAFTSLTKIYNKFILIYAVKDDFFPLHESGMKILHRALMPFRESIVLVCCHPHYNNSMVKRLNIRQMEETIYISYKHHNRIKENVDAIKRGLTKNGLKYSIDKEHLGYRGNIREYEKEIGQAPRLILFIIPEYLESAHCMFELSETFKNKDVGNRIYPLIDTGKYERTSKGALDLSDYWCKRRDELLQLMLGRTDTNDQWARELKDIDAFLNCIDNFWQYICDINSLDIETLTQNDAQLLIDEIKKDINQQADFSEETIKPELTPLELSTSGSPVPVQPIVNQFGNNPINIVNNNGTINFNR